MSIRLTQLATGEFYHIYNRGNSKQNIFHDDQDYRYFINLLKIMNTNKGRKSSRFKSKIINEEILENNKEIISIGAYCCMSNHFHILLKQELDGGISLFIQKLSTAYAMYYNRKYKHTGGLFEGKFKSKYAGEDTYLKYLFSYIHLNPLKILDKDWKLKTKSLTQEMYNFLTQYNYSSFREYYTEQYAVVSKKSFPDYFPTKTHFMREIFSWISLEN